MKSLISFLVLGFLVLGSPFSITAQDGMIDPATWSVSVKKVEGQTIELIFEGDVLNTWSVYGVDLPQDGPLPTKCKLNSNPNAVQLGGLLEVTPSSKKHDKFFDM